MPSETERLELSQEAIFSICTKCDRLRKCFKGVFSMNPFRNSVKRKSSHFSCFILSCLAKTNSLFHSGIWVLRCLHKDYNDCGYIQIPAAV